jgi:hypothetical protein
MVEGGTKGYLPTEYIKATKNPSNGGYLFSRQPFATSARDVYAAGVTFAVLLMGHDAIFKDAGDPNQIWRVESIFFYQEEVKTRITKAIVKVPKSKGSTGMRNLALFIQEMIRDDPVARPKLSEAIDFLTYLNEHGVDATDGMGLPFAVDYWAAPVPQSVPDSVPEADFSFI